MAVPKHFTRGDFPQECSPDGPKVDFTWCRVLSYRPPKCRFAHHSTQTGFSISGCCGDIARSYDSDTPAIAENDHLLACLARPSRSFSTPLFGIRSGSAACCDAVANRVSVDVEGRGRRSDAAGNGRLPTQGRSTNLEIWRSGGQGAAAAFWRIGDLKKGTSLRMQISWSKLRPRSINREWVCDHLGDKRWLTREAMVDDGYESGASTSVVPAVGNADIWLTCQSNPTILHHG